MSTRTVIEETIEAAAARGLRAETLADCRDVDDAADLAWFVREMRAAKPDVRDRLQQTLRFLESHERAR